MHTPSVDRLLARYQHACELKQDFNEALVHDRLRTWMVRIGGPACKMSTVASAAWDARADWDAWDLSWVAVTSNGALRAKFSVGQTS